MGEVHEPGGSRVNAAALPARPTPYDNSGIAMSRDQHLTVFSLRHRFARHCRLIDAMASFRVPVLRHVISGAAPYLRASQQRWAQVHDVRFLATQQTDRILEKYREKLDRKAKE